MQDTDDQTIPRISLIYWTRCRPEWPSQLRERGREEEVEGEEEGWTFCDPYDLFQPDSLRKPRTNFMQPWAARLLSWDLGRESVRTVTENITVSGHFPGDKSIFPFFIFITGSTRIRRQIFTLVTCRRKSWQLLSLSAACLLHSYKPIVDYIDTQFENYLQEELKIKRSLFNYHDTRIHICLYFIAPTGQSLKSLDLVTMKKLDSKVNLVLVLLLYCLWVSVAETWPPFHCERCVFHRHWSFRCRVRLLGFPKG